MKAKRKIEIVLELSVEEAIMLSKVMSFCVGGMDRRHDKFASELASEINEKTSSC